MSDNILTVAIEFVNSLSVAGVPVTDVVTGVLALIGGITVFGKIVAKFTKTPKDDLFFAKLATLVDKLKVKKDATTK